MKRWIKALQDMQSGPSAQWDPVAKFYDVPVPTPDSLSHAYSTNSSSKANDSRRSSQADGVQLTPR